MRRAVGRQNSLRIFINIQHQNFHTVYVHNPKSPKITFYFYERGKNAKIARSQNTKNSSSKQSYSFAYDRVFLCNSQELNPTKYLVFGYKPFSVYY